MKQQNTMIVMSEVVEWTVEDISAYCQLPVEVIIEFIELGLFETPVLPKLQLDSEKLSRVRSAARLFHDLKINAPGVILALELLDEIDTLRQEVSILQRLRR